MRTLSKTPVHIHWAARKKKAEKKAEKIHERGCIVPKPRYRVHSGSREPG